MSNQELFNAPLRLPASLGELMRQTPPLKTEEEGKYTELPLGTPLLKTYMVKEMGAGQIEDVQYKLNVADRHFQRLQNCGMFIVAHAFEARSDLKPALYRQLNTIVAYGASLYIDECVALTDPDNSQPPRELVTKTVIRPLEKYLDWCIETRQPNMLADIYHPRQYSWHASSDTIFLHDIDPLIDRLPSSPDWREDAFDHIRNKIHEF
jgi:hypothetical protein